VCVCIRNLYDTDETNFILEIRLAHAVQFLTRLSHFLAVVADFFKSSCSDPSHFDVGLIPYFFAVQIQEQKY
jgi:hypothetical protein